MLQAGSDEAGAIALRTLDEILAQAPKVDQRLFSSCTASLSHLRDRLIDAHVDRRRLEHVNAVISVVLAGHFPLGKVPWEDLRKARNWLSDAIS